MPQHRVAGWYLTIAPRSGSAVYVDTTNLAVVPL